MSTMTLKSLVERLAPGCRQALEQAAGHCHQRRHQAVEIEHWLLALLSPPTAELAVLCQQCGVDPGRWQQELQQTLERLPAGQVSAPSLSPHLVTLLRQAWLITSLEYGCEQVGPVQLIDALVHDDALAALTARRGPQLERFDAARVRALGPSLAVASPAPGATATGSSPALDQFTTDLTALARAGKLDPILGRDNEIRQMIDILTRRRQNNPILTGEAGVGKTAVVEGLAQQIVAGNVPTMLQQVSLRTLDLALLQAGAGMKGEFENRLRSLIDEVKASPQPIILFIDEAHTMIGAGGQAGQNDAANLLKPALARGELRTIAATTWAEYKKYFEKDAALTRRFQVVKVEEPSSELAVIMLRGLLPVMAGHHQVAITDEALHAACTLSKRYIPARQLPDKAVALLDTACARVAISQIAVPAMIADGRQQQAALLAEQQQLDQEQLTGTDHQPRLDEIRAALDANATTLAAMEQRWQQELAEVRQLTALSQQLQASELDDEQRQQLRTELAELRQQLAAIEQPLVHHQVDSQTIAAVIADWTGIPVGRMRSDEIQTVLRLADRLRQRVVGQDHALQLMAATIQTSRAQLGDERRPIGVFLLSGPSGVGKTETALALAEQLYGSEDAVTVINMSEFKEEHKVSLLLGSPPGYVGYGEGGVLTEAVRRRPYSVVLLDEMEKAHPGVQEIFYQIFDKGTVRDGEGRDIDFTNCVILMTANVGSETTLRLCADPELMPTIKGLAEALQPDLQAAFKPAFLGRLTLVPYLPLGEVQLAAIARLQLARIGQRLQRQHGAQLVVSDSAVDALVARCQDSGLGARVIISSLQHQLLPRLSRLVLEALAGGRPVPSLQLDWDIDGAVVAPRSVNKVNTDKCPQQSEFI
ncbi:MAG: type VI secretion system ATPase TssH [Gammaproteobacteria bacterium]|nr:type VI secretion system ATPase TssH [Gammaproteobacteria bacterium]